MSKLDQVSTPQWLATQLAALLPSELEGKVFDPAVGSGSLLDAVEARFGASVELLGVDIDDRSVRELRHNRPAWTVSRSDSLSSASRSPSLAWRSARQGAAAVVMNPPFSFRGGGGRIVDVDGTSIRVSPAAAFVYESLRICRPRWGLVAVLPVGTVSNSKDSVVWDWIRRRYAVEIVSRPSRHTFAGYVADTALVRVLALPETVQADGLGSILPRPNPGARVAPWLACRCIDVVRGRVPMHTVTNEGDIPLVHTIDIQDREVTRPAHQSHAHLATSGSVVLIPRVGTPDPRKVATLRGNYVLSDCLFALRPGDATSVEDLAQVILRNFEHVVIQYSGTGAKHITSQRLVAVLSDLGFEARTAKASSLKTQCRCGALVEHEAA